MNKQLADQLRGVEIPVDVASERDRIVGAFFEGLNAKLVPLGLGVKSAIVSFDPKVDVRTIFAKLQAAKLV
jgi:hypothetical protein